MPMNRRTSRSLSGTPPTWTPVVLTLAALTLAGAVTGCGGSKSRSTGDAPPKDHSGDASHAPAATSDAASRSSGAAQAPIAPIAPGESMAADFDDEAEGRPARDFAPLVGRWTIGAGEEGAGLVYDGSAGKPAPAADLSATAAALFGADGSLLTAAVTAMPLYAFSAYSPLAQMADGQVSVRFRPDGSGDQAAGIVFGLRANGDYLVVRANGPESNLVMLKVEGGRRNLVAKQPGVTIAAGSWHSLSLKVAGALVTAQVDDQPPLSTTLPAIPAGRVGLWSVSDKPVAFDTFTVEGGA